MSVIRTTLAALLIAVLLGAAVPCGHANTLSPGHAVWSNPALARGDLVRALLELRERQAKQSVAHRALEPGASKQNASPQRRFLILPVLYADDPVQPPVSIEEISSRFFDLGRQDSFASWWNRTSAGAFVPEGRVVQWLRLSGPKTQYENVVNGQPRFAATRRMAEEAVCLAAPSLGAWWDYDDDGPDGLPGSGDDDGILDFVFVLHPDPGIEITSEDNGIVALQDRMDLQTVLQDCQVGADPFVVASVFDPLGVWVHESGHLLGLVDLYDLEVSASDTDDGRATGGLGLWSLMATGTWGDDGRDPTDLDAYSRSLLGWNELGESSRDLNWILEKGAGRELLSLRPALDWGRERYLLEVRSPVNQDGIDGALPGEGVLIYRVDESAQDCRRPAALRLVELVQADGRYDLENLRNEGDAGDPYTGEVGANELGPLTDPNSYSREPAPQKLPPVIRVLRAREDAWTIGFEASSVGVLQLASARFEGGEVYLAPGDRQAWWPRFAQLGPAISTARMRVMEMDPGLTVEPLGWLDLELWQDFVWVLSDTLRIEMAASAARPDARLLLQLEVDGRLQEIEMGIPIGVQGGLSEDEFGDWQPLTASAGSPATRFALLAGAELPADAVSGWGIQTSTAAAYGNCSDLSLVSPWIAPSSTGWDSLDFWSRVHTEVGDPGEAWDGGIVELQVPGQAWVPLTPQGRGVLQIRPLSNSMAGTAATGGVMGIGGGPLPWSQYRAPFYLNQMPYRLRFRFGSDSSVFPLDELGGWSLAAAQVQRPEAAHALELRALGAGRMEAIFSSRGAQVDSVSLHWRQAPSLVWLPLTEAQALDADSSTRFEFVLPEAPYFEVGAFDGSQSRALLARDGWRRASPEGLLVFPNPSAGEMNFRAAPASVDRELLVYDQGGRRVRGLSFAAQLTVVSWDGRDDSGDRVASGVYQARLSGSPPAQTSLVIVR